MKKFKALLLISLFFIFNNAWAAEDYVVYYHNDALGSPVAATDEQGAILWKEHYLAYGEKVINDQNASNEKIGYTGKAFDKETGLNYYGARYYDPVVGRFMAVDPVGFYETNIHSFNRYAYANNNPYKFTDPTGKLPHKLDDGSIKDMSIDAHYGNTNLQIETKLAETPKVATTIFGYADDLKRLSTIKSKIPIELGLHLDAIPKDMIKLGSLETQLKKGLSDISKFTGRPINSIPVSMHGKGIYTVGKEAEVISIMRKLGANPSLLRLNSDTIAAKTPFTANTKSGTYFSHVHEMKKGTVQSNNFKYVNKHVVAYPRRP